MSLKEKLKKITYLRHFLYKERMYKYRERELLNLDAECTHNKYRNNATRNL